MDGPPKLYNQSVGWGFQAAAWDSERKRWVWAPPNPNARFQKNEITFISYNVWFDPLEVVKRMEAIGKIVVEHDPDVIAFQELTPYICGLLFNQEWAKKYFISDLDGSHLGYKNPEQPNAFRYGNALLSKVNFYELYLRDFPSRQDRKALWGSVLLADGSQLTLGTFHLESLPPSFELRKQQMELFQSVVAASNRTILVGDSNMEGDQENSVLRPQYKDAWLHLYPKEKNCSTFPTNPGVFESMMFTRRYDRIFYTDATLTAQSIKLMGNDFVPGTKTAPSDHWGMFFTMRVENNKLY